jgi:uncharacterized membrane protein YcaP (DUF421 family)
VESEVKEEAMGEIDWSAMLRPDTSPFELAIRGSVMYFAMLLLLRFLQKRRASSLGAADLLAIVLLADAAQNGMAGNYTSLTDGVVLVSVIVGWSAGLNWLSYRSSSVQSLVHPVSRVVVRDGEPVHAELRREWITDEELMTALREQGIWELRQVKEARLEGNGRLTATGRGTHPASQDEEPGA